MWKYFFILSLFCLLACDGKIDVGFLDHGSSIVGSTGGASGPPGSGGPTGGIGYQLDITESELALYPTSSIIIMKSVMSNNNQTGSFTLVSDGQSYEVLGLPANFIQNALDPMSPPPATLDFSSGVKAIEFEFHLPEAIETGVGSDLMYSVNGGIFGISGPGVRLCSAMLEVRRDGTYHAIITGQNSQVVLDSNLSYQNLPSRVGIEINANTSTFKIYFDGVEQVLLDNNYNPGNYPAVHGVRNMTENLPGNAGLVAAIRLITTAEDMTTNFSAGTTDPFGTLVP